MMLKKNRIFVSIVVSFAVLAYVMSIHTALIALWAKSEVSHGGLGWTSESTISIVYIFGAFCSLVYAATFLKPLLNALNEKRAMILF